MSHTHLPYKLFTTCLVMAALLLSSTAFSANPDTKTADKKKNESKEKSKKKGKGKKKNKKKDKDKKKKKSETESNSKTVIETKTPSKSKNNGNWCSWLSDKPGMLYKNKDNPYIQELRVFGRFHWQYAYLDGRGAEGNGTRKFTYDTNEIRRLRIGSKLRFLNYFEANASVNFSNDLTPLGGAHKIEYFNLYSATIALNVQKAFDLTSVDALEFRIGKEKTSPTAEDDTSSRFIKTVERSALGNYVSIPSSSGIFLASEKDRWIMDLGVSSGDLEREFTKFNNNYFYNLRLGYKWKNPSFVDKSRIDFRFIINGDEEKNANKNLESFGAYNLKWVSTLSTISKKGRFTLLTDLVLGDNGSDFDFDKKGRPTSNPDREGSFWGVVVMPSYWIMEDQLEAVFRYQYVGASEKEGYRIDARYSRIAGKVGGFTGPNDLSNGRGDSHHSAYLGLNYYLCGENAKIMTGIEYDDLNSGSQDVYAGTTFWAAFRMFF